MNFYLVKIFYSFTVRLIWNPTLGQLSHCTGVRRYLGGFRPLADDVTNLAVFIRWRRRRRRRSSHDIDKSHVIVLDSWYSIGTPESHMYKWAECCPYLGFFSLELIILHGMARYAGFLLAPAKAFGWGWFLSFGHKKVRVKHFFCTF